MDKIAQRLKAYIDTHPFEPGDSDCETGVDPQKPIDTLLKKGHLFFWVVSFINQLPHNHSFRFAADRVHAPNPFRLV